jgi:Zn-dependent protease with chaperone function
MAGVSMSGHGNSMATCMAAVLVVAACFGLGFGVAQGSALIALRRLRRAAGAPWVERARLAFPAREHVTQSMVFVPLALGGTVFFPLAPELGLAPAVWGVIAGLSAFFGVTIAAYRLERDLVRRDFAIPPRGVPLRALLRVIALGPYALMVALIPAHWGWMAVAVVALGTALLTVQVAGGWMYILRCLRLARPASQRLAEVVELASRRVGVRPRASLELDSPNANALALPLRRELVFTVSLLAALDDDELAAVAAHELGHLDEPWGVFLTRQVVPYLIVGAIAGIPLGGSFGPIAGLAPSLLMLAGFAILRRVGRRMEERSDRVAREHEGADAGTYARALEKMYEANLMPVVMRSKWMIHPHLYDRMVAAGVTPCYPRPDPPPKDSLAGIPLFILLTGCFAALFTSPPFWPVIRYGFL